MKTPNILITLGAAALTAITLNASAAGALLSPRATGNQITTVASTAGDPNLVAVDQGLVAPRIAANKTTAAPAAATGISQAAVCSHNMVASPKAVQACATSPTGGMACCKPVMASK